MEVEEHVIREEEKVSSVQCTMARGRMSSKDIQHEKLTSIVSFVLQVALQYGDAFDHPNDDGATYRTYSE